MPVHVSPDLVYLSCPDCGTPCVVALTLLTSALTIVHLASCARCADGVTIKCEKQIDRKTFVAASRAGMPIVEYDGKK